MKPSRLVVLLSLLVPAAPVSAQSIRVFTNQGDFLAATQSGYYLETFDGLPQGTGIPSPLNFAGNGFTYTAAAPDNFFNAGTGSDVWLSTNAAADTITFTFTSGNVSAAGGFFFTSDVNGDSVQNTITVQTNNSGPFTISSSTPTSFLGFVADAPFTTLALSADQTSGFTWPTANNFIVGSAAIPEPAVWALMLVAGSAACSGRLIRRRARQTTADADVAPAASPRT